MNNSFASGLAHMTGVGLLIVSIVMSIKGSSDPDRLSLMFAVQAVYWALVAIFHELRRSRDRTGDAGPDGGSGD